MRPREIRLRLSAKKYYAATARVAAYHPFCIDAAADTAAAMLSAADAAAESMQKCTDAGASHRGK